MTPSTRCVHKIVGPRSGGRIRIGEGTMKEYAVLWPFQSVMRFTEPGSSVPSLGKNRVRRQNAWQSVEHHVQHDQREIGRAMISKGAKAPYAEALRRGALSRFSRPRMARRPPAVASSVARIVEILMPLGSAVPCQPERLSGHVEHARSEYSDTAGTDGGRSAPPSASRRHP